MIYAKYFKRPLDIVFSFVSLVVLSPILILIAVTIFLVDGRPVVFKQDRVGLHKKHFSIYKFRTMIDGGKGLFLSYDNDPRVTRLGGFLRKNKLDELPQFFNVLFGDMSIVGPRPEVPKFAQKKFGKKYDIIFSVKPGITGLSSIKFLNEVEYFPRNGQDRYKIYFSKILPKKITLDIEYIKNVSLWGDIKILAKTIKNLVG